MKNISVFVVFLWMFISGLSAGNDARFFRLIIPTAVHSLDDSKYSKIEFRDARSDLEFEEIHIEEPEFENQLNTLIRQMTGQQSGDGILFVQLRNLMLGQKNQHDYAHLRITLYSKVGEDYFFIDTHDSKLLLENKKEYAKVVSQAIADCLGEYLPRAYTDPKPYSLDNVFDIAFFEKENLKAYNTKTFADGLYPTFYDFVNQTPAAGELSAKFKKEELKEVKIKSEGNDSLRKVSAGEAYAVVIDGRPYICKGKKYIAMRRADDEFCFEDEVSHSRLGISPSFSVGIGSGGYRGAGIGIGVFSRSKKEKVTYKIDHLNGDFVKMKSY